MKRASEGRREGLMGPQPPGASHREADDHQTGGNGHTRPVTARWGWAKPERQQGRGEAGPGGVHSLQGKPDTHSRRGPGRRSCRAGRNRNNHGNGIAGRRWAVRGGSGRRILMGDAGGADDGSSATRCHDRRYPDPVRRICMGSAALIGGPELMPELHGGSGDGYPCELLLLTELHEPDIMKVMAADVDGNSTRRLPAVICADYGSRRWQLEPETSRCDRLKSSESRPRTIVFVSSPSPEAGLFLCP